MVASGSGPSGFPVVAAALPTSPSLRLGNGVLGVRPVQGLGYDVSTG